MQKKKLFVIVSILTVIFLFGTAAICNQCGIGTESTEEDTSDEQSQVSGSGNQEASGATVDDETTATDGTGDTEGGEDTEGEESSEGENNPPIIESVTLGDRSVINEDEIITFTGRELPFTVQSSDPDGDELRYDHWIEGADVVSVEQIDNEYHFVVIPTSTGNNEVEVAVFDEEDAADNGTTILSVGFEEGSGGGFVFDDITIAPDVSLSGSIDEDRVVSIAGDSSGVPSVYIGDTPAGGITKGFLSFNVRELSEKTVDEAEIIISSFTRVNDPESLLGSNLDFFAVDYGESLDGSNYTTSRYTYLTGMAPDRSSFRISGNTLKDAIQEVLDDSGRDNFQVKLFFENANTDGDADGFIIYMSDIQLIVTYYPA
jgi:hypothetical protein